mmetsp:Transcript_97205/g.270503  ORF Transcript_97205/g.270503 Transcript_97205/m.270503 type:complete len:215 (-) Transcript_97205:999-1643(-)
MIPSAISLTLSDKVARRSKSRFATDASSIAFSLFSRCSEIKAQCWLSCSEMSRDLSCGPAPPRGSTALWLRCAAWGTSSRSCATSAATRGARPASARSAPSSASRTARRASACCERSRHSRRACGSALSMDPCGQANGSSSGMHSSCRSRRACRPASISSCSQWSALRPASSCMAWRIEPSFRSHSRRCSSLISKSVRNAFCCCSWAATLAWTS